MSKGRPFYRTRRKPNGTGLGYKLTLKVSVRGNTRLTGQVRSQHQNAVVLREPRPKDDAGGAVLEADLRRPEQAHMPMFESEA